MFIKFNAAVMRWSDGWLTGPGVDSWHFHQELLLLNCSVFVFSMKGKLLSDDLMIYLSLTKLKYRVQIWSRVQTDANQASALNQPLFRFQTGQTRPSAAPKSYVWSTRAGSYTATSPWPRWVCPPERRQSCISYPGKVSRNQTHKVILELDTEFFSLTGDEGSYWPPG